MPENPNGKEEENSQSSKNIQIPPIPKQAAGAVAGAAAGSIAGPIGAVVGGVVGAVTGKAAEKRRPIAPASRRTVRSVMKTSKTISKKPRRGRPSKKTVAKHKHNGIRTNQAKLALLLDSNAAQREKDRDKQEHELQQREREKQSGGANKADDKSGCPELVNGGSCLPPFLFWASERVKHLTVHVVLIRPCRNSEARSGKTGASRMGVSVLG